MILDPVLDLLRGKAITIPPLDGAFRPNTALEQAGVLARCPAPDGLAVAGGRLLVSSGSRVLSVDGLAEVASFEAPATALAAEEGGAAAVGLENGRIALLGASSDIAGFKCPVALAFDGPQTLYVCNGSERNAPSKWATDLMQGGTSGSLWRVDLAGGSRTCLASGLAFPYGLFLDKVRDRIVVSECWRHRLIAIPIAGGAPSPIVSKLPGYPARLAPRVNGGALLALFAPRNRLIEMVLREDAYRTDMMVEIDPRYWIAPSLSASRSFLEPLQSGGVRVMGIHKPWAPSRSYGLVAELDGDFQPIASHHSRADGHRHGVTSAIEHDGRILAASKGGDMVLALPGASAP